MEECDRFARAPIKDGWLPTEPSVIINGVVLIESQAMTVRVALRSFAINLSINGLGNDNHGKIMRSSYLARIAEIETMYTTNLTPTLTGE